MKKILLLLYFNVLSICVIAQKGEVLFQSTVYDCGIVDLGIIDDPSNFSKELTCFFYLSNSSFNDVIIEDVFSNSRAVKTEFSNEKGEIKVNFSVESMVSSMIEANEYEKKFKKPILVRFKSLSTTTRLYIQGTIKIAKSGKQKMIGRNYLWYRTNINGKCGAEDANGKVMVPANYSNVTYMSGLRLSGFIVNDGENVGFYNQNGICLIPTQRGYKRIKTSCTNKSQDFFTFWKENGTAGFCDESGKEVYIFPYNWDIEAVDMVEMFPQYYSSKFFIWWIYESLLGERVCRILDANGNKIIEVIIKNTYDLNTDRHISLRLNYSTGDFVYYDVEQKKDIVCGNVSQIKTTQNPLENNILSIKKSKPRNTFGWDYLTDGKIQYNAKVKVDENREIELVYFTPTGVKKIENEVSEIFVIDPRKKGCAQSVPHPPIIEKIIYHDIGKDKEYCSVVTRGYISDDSGRGIGVEYQEIKIDDDTANKLLAFTLNKTEWKNKTDIVFETTTREGVTPPKVEYIRQ